MSRIGQGGDIIRGYLLNNVWLRTTAGPLAERGRFRETFSPTMVDYNAYGKNSGLVFQKSNYGPSKEKHGWDKHSIRVDYKELFQEPVKSPTGTPQYRKDLVGTSIPKDWHFEHNLLQPKKDSKLIDAGTVLDNLTGPYLGKAPDIGAHEVGLGTAWYGIRIWDLKAKLVYGIPKTWKKTELAKAAEYATLGCPDINNAKVLLTSTDPRVFALMKILPTEGKARWDLAQKAVSSEKGAITKILKFQDGLYIRLYQKNQNAILIASRVEPGGVLHVTAGCTMADLPKARLKMFQFARSFYR